MINGDGGAGARRHREIVGAREVAACTALRGGRTPGLESKDGIEGMA